MQPLRNQVLIQETATTNETQGGIILQAPVESGARPGVIAAVGPDVEFVSVKDVVALDWSKGLPVTVSGIKAVLVSEEDIRGIF